MSTTFNLLLANVLYFMECKRLADEQKNEEKQNEFKKIKHIKIRR